MPGNGRLSIIDNYLTPLYLENTNYDSGGSVSYNPNTRPPLPKRPGNMDYDSISELQAETGSSAGTFTSSDRNVSSGVINRATDREACDGGAGNVTPGIRVSNSGYLTAGNMSPPTHRFTKQV